MLNSSNKKKPKSPSFPQSAKEPASVTNLNIFADGSTLKGDFTSSSDTRIGGSLEGDLKVEGTIFLTEGGSVEGMIQGDTVNIAGSVKGSIVATHKVFLASAAKVQGSISAERLVIEEGAVFNGDCKMGVKPRKLTSNSTTASNGKNKQLAKKPA